MWVDTELSTEYLPPSLVTLLTFKDLFIYILNLCVCVCVCVWMYGSMHVGTWGDQKRESDLLVLDLQAVVAYLIWVLGTKLQSNLRVVSFLNH